MEGKEPLLQAWSLDFENLGKSRKGELHTLQELLRMLHLDSQLPENEDFILDTPITTEEVYAALKRLRRGSLQALTTYWQSTSEKVEKQWKIGS